MNYGSVVHEHDGPKTVNHIDVVEPKNDKMSFVVGMFTLAALAIIAVVVIAALANTLH